MKTAQLLKDNLKGFNGHAALYKVTPPIRDEGYDEDDATMLIHYVIASAVSGGFVGALQPEEQELANQAGPLLSRMANTEELEFLMKDERWKALF